jgi:hypothetical protein
MSTALYAGFANFVLTCGKDKVNGNQAAGTSSVRLNEAPRKRVTPGAATYKEKNEKAKGFFAD